MKVFEWVYLIYLWIRNILIVMCFGIGLLIPVFNLVFINLMLKGFNYYRIKYPQGFKKLVGEVEEDEDGIEEKY